ncbi:hypothetical protein F5Y16DRAFT_147379 [Xylariaceae sp. FL0255]|nr:hypothetical protein F5Y16DRAFT_147379 [Xylariaceae sp. FL0255]
MARGKILLRYKVPVRRYRCANTHRPVQSLNVDLHTVGCPKLIFRRIHKDNRFKDDPQIIDIINSEDPAKYLENDIDDDGKVIDEPAHGIHFSLCNDSIQHSPVWARLRQSELCKNNDIYVLNLDSFESFSIPITRICWVPTYEAEDGRLYTIIGCPGKVGRDKDLVIPAIIQRRDYPEETRLQSLSEAQLSGLFEIRTVTKEGFLESQSTLIKERYLLQTRASRPVSLTFPLPFPARQQFKTRRRYIQSDNPNFITNSDDGTSSSDEEYSTVNCRPSSSNSSTQQVNNDNKESWHCTCRYSDLGPTIWSLRPRHRHVKDEECPFSPHHVNHCIFAEHRPSHCVIPSSGEEHVHCLEGVPLVQSPIRPPPLDQELEQLPDAPHNMDGKNIDSDDVPLQIGDSSSDEQSLSMSDTSTSDVRIYDQPQSRPGTPPEDPFLDAELSPEGMDLGCPPPCFQPDLDVLDTIRVEYRIICRSPGLPELQP